MKTSDGAHTQCAVWEMTPAAIMDAYSPPGRMTWPTWLAQACTPGPVAHRVGELRDELRRDGAFTYPILVDEEDWSVNRGTHRVCAALLGGHANLSVTNDLQYPFIGSAHVGISGLRGLLDDDETDRLLEAIDPLRLPSGEWVDFYSGSPRVGGFRSSWRCPTGAETELANALQAAITSFCPDLAGPGLRVIVCPSPDDDALVVESDVPILFEEQPSEPGSGLRLVVDGYPARTFVVSEGWRSEKIVIEFDGSHPEFDRVFETGYYLFKEPGFLDWGHDGRRFAIRHE